MNNAMICRGKYLDIMNLKILPTSCSYYNSEAKSPKILIPKMKLNRIDGCFFCATSLTNYMENFEKITGFFKSFCSVISKSLPIHFNPSQIVCPVLLLNGLVMVTNKESQLLANVSNKELDGGIRSKFAYFIKI